MWLSVWHLAWLAQSAILFFMLLQTRPATVRDVVVAAVWIAATMELSLNGFTS